MEPGTNLREECAGERVGGEEGVLGGDVADILDEGVACIGNELFVLFFGCRVRGEVVGGFEEAEGCGDKVKGDEGSLEGRA